MHWDLQISVDLKISENQARNTNATGFSKMLLNPCQESKALTTKPPLRISNQGQIYSHQHSSEQTKHNNTKHKTNITDNYEQSNRQNLTPKSTTVAETTLFQVTSNDPKERWQISYVFKWTLEWLGATFVKLWTILLVVLFMNAKSETNTRLQSLIIAL